MELLTKEIEQKLMNAPIGSHSYDNRYDAEVIVKYFSPMGAGTWLIIEGEKQEDGDWLFYGLCYLFKWEWGFVSLSHLEKAKLPFGLKIERDLYSKGTVKELKAALPFYEQ